MFQAAELGQKISDREYKQREPELWHALLMQQQRLRRKAASPVLVDFAGVRGAGKSESANLLNKWMDARWITTHGFGPVVEAEYLRPIMWRYWMRLPPRGQIGIYLSGRYSIPLLEYVHKRITRDEFQHQLERINTFEKMLADDGALILKFWMHIGRDLQKQRLEKLQKDKLNHWRVTDADWQNWEMYDRFIDVAEQIVSMTSTGHAPWEIVEGEDSNYRGLRVGEVMHDALDRHITRVGVHHEYARELDEKLVTNGNNSNGGSQISTSRSKTVFSLLDGNKSLPRKDYKEALKLYQAKLSHLQHIAQEKQMTTILVFEGADAGGKGGCIRQITNALDARLYKVHPFAAPTQEEHAHHYLWRFWRCIPRDGRMSIFDRSWYGRVLVERVEGFASSEEWRRGYAEINDFENQLIDHGILLLKFWMHISKDEQLKRFKARENTPHKQWKQTEEDWRNRERWNDYQAAAHDLMQLTDTRSSPWVLVESNDKPYGRVKVLNRLCGALENALQNHP